MANEVNDPNTLAMIAWTATDAGESALDVIVELHAAIERASEDGQIEGELSLVDTEHGLVWATEVADEDTVGDSPVTVLFTITWRTGA